MTHAKNSFLYTTSLAIVINLALNLSGIKLVDKLEPDSVKVFSKKAISDFGITHEMFSNINTNSYMGTDRVEVVSDKMKFSYERVSYEKNKPRKITNIFANYSKNFEIA